MKVNVESLDQLQVRLLLYLLVSYLCTAEARIQKGYHRLQAQVGNAGGAVKVEQFPGVLGQLMERGQLPLELIRANITELMAGGVDTVSL